MFARSANRDKEKNKPLKRGKGEYAHKDKNFFFARCPIFGSRKNIGSNEDGAPKMQTHKNWVRIQKFCLTHNRHAMRKIGMLAKTVHAVAVSTVAIPGPTRVRWGVCVVA